MSVSEKVRTGAIVGSLVYEAYAPAKCGKVIEDLGAVQLKTADGETYNSVFHKLRVRWLNGGESVVPSNHFNDFEDLVESHRRKFEKHSATLDKLKLL